MAQKAQKTLAARNAAILNRTHLIAFGVHALFLVLHLLRLRRSLSAWCLLSAPSVAIEIWFERIGRPTYAGQGTARELRRAGEDLEAKGLTEWMWDVIYWTWGCVVLAAMVGDWAWWLYGVVPVYSAWLAWSTFSGARAGLSGLGGAPRPDAAGSQSKRQAKLEKKYR